MQQDASHKHHLYTIYKAHIKKNSYNIYIKFKTGRN